ncbi:MAG: polysaccharide deacetylase family protein [Myxococcota bacterium]
MNLARVKRKVKGAIASNLGWQMLGPWLRKPGVIVLMYHRIAGPDRSLGGLAVETFTEQMQWLRDRCDPIWPEELIERAKRPRQRKPAVLVTFDDGFRDYHDLAYPVLSRLEIPGTVFLATSFMDRGGTGMMWTEEVQWAALSTQRDSVKLPWSTGSAVPLPDRKSRTKLGDLAREHMKALPDAERRAALDALLQELGQPPPRDREMLTWDEVRRTQQWTRYGGHTHTHPILSRLSREQAEAEIVTCRDRIAAETGKTPATFAYPNGRASDYTRETQDILRAHGFTLGFSTIEGIAGPDSDWLAIKRLPSQADNIADFACLAAGLSLA